MNAVQLWRVDLQQMGTVLGELSGRAFWYCFTHMSLFLALYLLGNLQEFLDGTQLVLLRLTELAAVATTAAGVYRMAYTLFRALTTELVPLVQFVATVVATLAAAVVLLLSTFLLTWFQL